MYVTEEEASERSRESMESARSETRKRRAACAWTGSERAFEGEQDRIHEGVVTQGMEGDRVHSLWRAMSVIEGGQGTSEQGSKGSASKGSGCGPGEVTGRGDAGAPAAGGDGMEGVRTEAGTREKDGWTAGG